jgi:probable F420-dependent oxidoreductase
MDAARYDGPLPERPPARVLAALNPRMLQLAAARCAGAHTYFMPPEHTAKARAILGPDAVLAVEVGVSLSGDDDAVAAHVDDHARRENYRRALLFAGLDEADLMSRRLVDAVVARGSVEAVLARVREHLNAGATHVCVQALGADRGAVQLEQLRELAPALRELDRQEVTT